MRYRFINFQNNLSIFQVLILIDKQMLRQGTIAGLLLVCIISQNVTIAVIGTNDIHGAAFPTSLKRSDTHQEYKYGGLAYMGRLINIIKNQYKGNVIYLDAGDQFQGGIQSSKLISSGKIINDFFGLLEVNGSAIGNHQFDFGPQFLFPFLKAKDSPNLAANLRNENSKKDFLPNQRSSQLYSFASGIKLGVIGLSTVETPSTTAGFSSHKFPEYKFLQYKQIVIDQAEKLRRNGANAVLIVSHVGNECSASEKYGKWKNDTKQESGCNESDQMTVLLKSLPKGTIQGVVQGHHHTFSHIFIDGVPVMGNINGGYYFNVMYLTFRNKNLVDAQIQGPIPVCERVFQNTQTCNYKNEEQLKVAGPLVKWKFHNQQIYADPKVQTIYEQQWYPKMGEYLCDLVENQVHLFEQRDTESELGNLITNLIHENFTFADFIFLNPGGFRTQWVPSVLQQQHLYNMFPFGNQLVSFSITGRQLLKTLEILQSGGGGFYDFWGIQTTATIVDKQHKFISATMADGSEIDPEKTYIGITVDFIIMGGDDFATVLSSKAYIPRNVRYLGEFRDSIREQLKAMKIIKKGSLIDPNHPRLILI